MYILTHTVSFLYLFLLRSPLFSSSPLLLFCRYRTTAVKVALWSLLLLHGIAFPVATFLGAAWVRREAMGGSLCGDTPDTKERQLKDIRATGEVALWRYYLDYDFEARYHWFRTVNMTVMIVIVWAGTYLVPATGASARDIGEANLACSMVQLLVVGSYLALLCALKPYVNSRLRHWKQYVMMFNQVTSIILILARLLAEQAQATVDTTDTIAADATDATALLDATRFTDLNDRTALNSTFENTVGSTVGTMTSGEKAAPIFVASLVLMYIAMVCCVLQFAVLLLTFLYSLFTGAKKEQKIISRRIEYAAVVALAIQR